MLEFLTILGILLTGIFAAQQRFSRGLDQFTGPLLASFSDVWKIWYQVNNFQKPTLVDVHRRYGDVVRIGPNELSFARPEAVRDILGSQSLYGSLIKLLEAPSYSTFSGLVQGKLLDVLFTGRDPVWHDRQRRLINTMLSTTSMLKYESHIDSGLDAMIKKLEQIALDVTTTLDLGKWFRYLSVDIMAEITFGEPMGFLESGYDLADQLANVQKSQRHWIYVWSMPVLDRLIFKNPFLVFLQAKGFFQPHPPFPSLIQRQFSERYQYWMDRQKSEMVLDRETMLDTLLRIQRENPQVPDFAPFMHAMSMMGAGVDAFMVTMSSIFYFLLKNPPCYHKLEHELSSLPVDGSICTSFNTVKDLPYLGAIIDESMRLHSADRLGSPRITPPTGLMVAGTYVPGGVQVTAYRSVIHHNQEIFGLDADNFIPERWLLDHDGENKHKSLKEMRAALFPFGAGKYNCMGKNLSRIMVMKTVASLIRNFQFELHTPTIDWTLEPGTFAKPKELLIRLRSIHPRPISQREK